MYGYKEITKISLAAIQKLNSHGIACNVLTKGILPSELINYSMKNEYGITLVSLDENFRKRMEPGAAPLIERLAALESLHRYGCRTWVSIEPYPTPNIIEQDLIELLNRISFADRIIFGRTNYNKQVSNYKPHREFYNSCAIQVKEFCSMHGISCHIKSGTQTWSLEIVWAGIGQNKKWRKYRNRTYVVLAKAEALFHICAVLPSWWQTAIYIFYIGMDARVN